MPSEARPGPARPSWRVRARSARPAKAGFGGAGPVAVKSRRVTAKPVEVKRGAARLVMAVGAGRGYVGSGPAWRGWARLGRPDEAWCGGAGLGWVRSKHGRHVEASPGEVEHVLAWLGPS